jgi:hypothetical protein
VANIVPVFFKRVETLTHNVLYLFSMFIKLAVVLSLGKLFVLQEPKNLEKSWQDCHRLLSAQSISTL